MSIATTDNKVTYSGNGATTEWPFAFTVLEASHLQVILTNPTGAETTLSSDYVVDLTNHKVTYPGYLSGQEPDVTEQPPVLAAGWKITLLRVVPYTQETDLGGRWPFTSIEAMVDKTTQQTQQLAEVVERCVKAPVSSSTKPDDLIEELKADANAAHESAMSAAASLAQMQAEVNAAAQEAMAGVMSEINTSVNTATTQAANASASEANAATSETNALGYKNNAQASATAAQTSAENASNAASQKADYSYATYALMAADLTPADGKLALVYKDGANNGVYVKSGATGSGSWVLSDYYAGVQNAFAVLFNAAEEPVKALSAGYRKRVKLTWESGYYDGTATAAASASGWRANEVIDSYGNIEITNDNSDTEWIVHGYQIKTGGTINGFSFRSTGGDFNSLIKEAGDKYRFYLTHGSDNIVSDPIADEFVKVYVDRYNHDAINMGALPSAIVRDDADLTLEFPNHGTYINTSGVAVNNGNYQLACSDYADVDGYTKYITQLPTSVMPETVADVAFYDYHKVFVSALATGSGKIPNGAAFARFTYYNASNSTTDSQSNVYTPSPLKLTSAVGGRINNVYEPSDAIHPAMAGGKWLNAGVLVENGNADLAVSDYIAIKDGCYNVSCKIGVFDQASVIAFYDSALAYISGVAATEAVVPSNAEFFRLCNYDVATNEIVSHDAVTYKQLCVERLDAIEADIDGIHDSLSTVGTDWSTKNWVMLGDSLTEDNWRAAKHYWTYIQEDTGINLTNLAIGGTGYRRGGTSSVLNQARNHLTGGADLITIFAGINDVAWENNPTAALVGEITDTESADTIMGCMNATIDAIEAVYTTYAPLVVISPLPACIQPDIFPETYTNPNQYPLVQDCIMNVLVARMSELCKMRGYPFLDLFHSSGIQPQKATCREAYFKAGAGYAADGLHPNAAGHKLFYKKIMPLIEAALMPSV